MSARSTQRDGEGSRRLAGRAPALPCRFARDCVRCHRSISFRSTTPRWTSNSLTTGACAPFSGGPGSHCCSTYSRDPFFGFYLSLDLPSKPPAMSGDGDRCCSRRPAKIRLAYAQRSELDVADAMARHAHCISTTEQNFIRTHSSEAVSNMACASITGHRPPLASAGTSNALWGTLMARVHVLPGTTSSNVIARGDYPSERKAVLDAARIGAHPRA